MPRPWIETGRLGKLKNRKGRCSSGQRSQSPLKKWVRSTFQKHLLMEGKVAVSPGIGLVKYGEGFVRFALVENEARIKQAVKGFRTF